MSSSNNPTKPNLNIIIPVSSSKYISTLGTPSPKHKYIEMNTSKKSEYTLNFDGASRGNPGPAGNPGNAGSAGSPGSAANPTSFNCVAVTPGGSYPLTVNGQIVVSWNPQ